MRLVTIKSYTDEGITDVLCSLLESENIMSYAIHKGGNRGRGSKRTWIELQVQAHDANRAAEIMIANGYLKFPESGKISFEERLLEFVNSFSLNNIILFSIAGIIVISIIIYVLMLAF